jgi:hypothetical protein
MSPYACLLICICRKCPLKLHSFNTEPGHLRAQISHARMPPHLLGIDTWGLGAWRRTCSGVVLAILTGHPRWPSQKASPQTLNPKSQTPNPEPQTPNPKPQTPKPQTQSFTPAVHPTKLSSRHVPLSRLPSVKVLVPCPLILSFLNSPSYTLPLVQVNLPLPCFLSSAYSPT